MDAVRQMMNGLAHVKLVENGWQPWPQFRQTVRHMHLLLQPSYTESFNVVTADGVAEGVPSVVSAAIDWAPRSWIAPVDDANAMARVGRKTARQQVGCAARKSRAEGAQPTGDVRVGRVSQLTSIKCKSITFVPVAPVITRSPVSAKNG